MPINERQWAFVSEDLVAAPHHIRRRDPGSNLEVLQLLSFDLCPGVKLFPSGHEAGLRTVFFKHIQCVIEDYVSVSLPLSSQPLLVGFDLSRTCKALACPSRSLFESLVIIEDRIPDTALTEMQVSQLDDKQPVIGVDFNRLFRFGVFKRYGQVVGAIFLAECVEPLRYVRAVDRVKVSVTEWEIAPDLTKCLHPT